LEEKDGRIEALSRKLALLASNHKDQAALIAKQQDQLRKYLSTPQSNRVRSSVYLCIDCDKQVQANLCTVQSRNSAVIWSSMKVECDAHLDFNPAVCTTAGGSSVSQFSLQTTPAWIFQMKSEGMSSQILNHEL